ncbi:S8 family serine peptidase [Bradyrhizobium sp. BRP22]|uniref:S8 family serine peptidase n=1 Tax=Bradyrhizobium sp. BRP22 TaxID=2793821 RepID=UPI001CD670C7|nr:S8 family serine peptidase [Bradyrhizobium sp. BRP22]
MRAPEIRVAPRVPSVSTNVGPRVNTNIGGAAVARTPSRISVTPHVMPRIGVQSTLPSARYSPNIHRACDPAYRGSDGDCLDRPVSSANGGNVGNAAGKKANGGPRNNAPQTVADLRAVPNELVAEIDGALTDAQIEQLARRHRLVRVEMQNVPLLGSTIGLFRITDRRPVDVVRRALAGDASVRSVQLNFRYLLQDQKTAPTEGDPAQYALAQLRLPQAHTLVRGMNVTIAVIDSGIDASHPELANTIADTFDAIGSKEGPHAHGTGIAGAIAAHARLMGSAPEVRLLAIRAFGATANGAQSSSYVILKGLDYAALHGAQIINMSFAGPKDPLIERAVAASAARGIVLVGAAGNAGAKSAPLYPAANPNVIAVSGTDAQEKLFSASNRGNHIALAAPGADIFLPAPDGKYQIVSGTSFSAAFVSGIAALVLERNPSLKPNEVRSILTGTARDLGDPGRDDLFGAGSADAFAAVSAAAPPAVPLASSKDTPAAPARDNTSVSRAMEQPVPSMAADKSAANDAKSPAAQ